MFGEVDGFTIHLMMKISDIGNPLKASARFLSGVLIRLAEGSKMRKYTSRILLTIEYSHGEQSQFERDLRQLV
jgi:hypothetical protein